MKQSDTLGGLILSPLTRSVFCHLQSERCRAERKVCLFAFVSFSPFLLCQPVLLVTFLGLCAVVVVAAAVFYFFFFLPV